MTGTPMAIDEKELLELDSLKAYAEVPEHYYRAETDKTPPGDRDEYIRAIQAVSIADGSPRAYKVVFSITENKGHTFRQLSVSIHGGPPDRWPHPLVCTMFAKRLGFTGDWRKDWIAYKEEPVRAIVLCQELPRS
jgi:hypothetical protein